MSDKRYLTIKQVADMVGVSRQAVYNLLNILWIVGMGMIVTMSVCMTMMVFMCVFMIVAMF